MNRTHLCELLWDSPNDPRGELRWCLSKIRSVFDEPGRRRVQASGDLITLALTDCFVDAIEITAAMRPGIEHLDVQRLRTLAGLFTGDFLDGLELERSPHINSWLTAQRHRFRACHTAVLEHLVQRVPADADEVFTYLEQWREHAPLDRRVHELQLAALARRGRIHEGDEYLTAMTKVFESEGLDCTPLQEAWRKVRSRPAAVAQSADQNSEAVVSEVPAVRARRASIAVMPLADLTHEVGAHGGLARGLAHDVITRLAKLRSVAVIAQGTVFALSERGVGPEEAGRALNVDYVASGAVRRHANRIRVTLELVETRMARIIWAEDFDYRLDDAFLVLEEIGNRIVAAIASEIETAERNRAVLKQPSSLDAWEAYHRGLWHMYRFNGGDNQQAQDFFRMALRLDPTFGRAYAGLSFTHFQNVFLHRAAEREREIDRALESAGQGVIIDDRDPAAHWAMGRALWLRGRQEQCLLELDRAVELSPNFALGHYTLAFVHSQSGDARTAIGSADHSRLLSPFDPLLFAMLASRAIAHVRMGEFEEAAHWSVQATGRPNAHVHIRAIAAQCLAAAGRIEEARAMTAVIHATSPQYGIEDFLAAFRFSPESAHLFRAQAARIGLR